MIAPLDQMMIDFAAQAERGTPDECEASALLMGAALFVLTSHFGDEAGLAMFSSATRQTAGELDAAFVTKRTWQ